MSLLNDNVVPFPSPKSPKVPNLTSDELAAYEDMVDDLELTFNCMENELLNSKYAHAAIIILLDSEGQVYSHAATVAPTLTNRITSLSTFMEAFNDICSAAPETSELSE